jgi:hypothetical protein
MRHVHHCCGCPCIWLVLEHESTVSFSDYRHEGTLPALYPIDNNCCKIHNLKALKSLDTFRNVIHVVKPTRSVDSRNVYPLTASHAEALLPKFDPTKLPTARLYYLQCLLPFELRRQVMSHYGLADVLQLAITVQAPAFFDETVRKDPVRKRVAMSIQASKLLHKKEHQTLLTGKDSHTFKKHETTLHRHWWRELHTVTVYGVRASQVPRGGEMVPPPLNEHLLHL